MSVVERFEQHSREIANWGREEMQGNEVKPRKFCRIIGESNRKRIEAAWKSDGDAVIAAATGLRVTVVEIVGKDDGWELMANPIARVARFTKIASPRENAWIRLMEAHLRRMEFDVGICTRREREKVEDASEAGPPKIRSRKGV